MTERHEMVGRAAELVVRSLDEDRLGRGGDRDRERPAEVAPLAAARRPHSRRSAVPRWFGALVASLALTVIGLALFSGWLYTRVAQQQATIARLSDRLEMASVRMTALAKARSDLEQQQGHLVNRLALVSTPGTEVCPLRPSDPAGRATRC